MARKNPAIYTVFGSPESAGRSKYYEDESLWGLGMDRPTIGEIAETSKMLGEETGEMSGEMLTTSVDDNGESDVMEATEALDPQTTKTQDGWEAFQRDMAILAFFERYFDDPLRGEVAMMLYDAYVRFMNQRAIWDMGLASWNPKSCRLDFKENRNRWFPEERLHHILFHSVSRVIAEDSEFDCSVTF
ncbi:hypothetical protein Bbelb_317530 [Branchiostoma belcheri]|nr:hypothetical protein Bbelb_317530 [Branchiostoma belcheri]